MITNFLPHISNPSLPIMLFFTIQVFNFTLIPDIFPSSYFMQSHLTQQNLEEIDFLTHIEKQNRISNNYVYNQYGQKTYPFRDDFFAKKRQMDQKTCKYQKISGICTVFSIKDDEFHANHLIVKMEFQPKLNRQTAADLTSSLTKNYQNLSYDFAIEVGIAEGKQWKCQKLELIEGKCVEWDYEVAWEAATDSQ